MLYWIWANFYKYIKYLFSIYSTFSMLKMSYKFMKYSWIKVRFSIFLDEQRVQRAWVAENSGKWPTISKLSLLDFFEGRFIGAALFLFENFPIKAKAKLHCWHTNCRIHFVINYLRIYYPNMEKIEKNWRKKWGKNDICFFCQFDKKLSSDQTNRLLPHTGYTHRWQLDMKRSLYLSITLLVFQSLS